MRRKSRGSLIMFNDFALKRAFFKSGGGRCSTIKSMISFGNSGIRGEAVISVTTDTRNLNVFCRGFGSLKVGKFSDEG